MKTIVAVLALCACTSSALAAPDCRAINGSAERLACYDAASATKKDKPTPAQADDASRAAYKDPLIAEDARIATKLKGICRGC